LGKEFVRNWCKQIHGTTKRIPEEFFKEEQPYLFLIRYKWRREMKQKPDTPLIGG
jgi:hypothetical protein